MLPEWGARFKAELTARRNVAGVSFEKMCQDAKVDGSVVSDWFRMDAPRMSVENVEKIAQAVKVTAVELLYPDAPPQTVAMLREVLDEVRAIRAAVAPQPTLPRAPDPGSLRKGRAARAAAQADPGAESGEALPGAPTSSVRRGRPGA